MKITDISKKHFSTFACCFEDWSNEMKVAEKHKRIWYDYMKRRGLGIKLAFDNDGEVSGLIQYIPSEFSFIEGDGTYLITCIWVHGYSDKGIGDRQNRGMGSKLLQTAENDIKSRGAKGVAAWGLSEDFWMQSSFYKKYGYEPADTIQNQELVWKPFLQGANPPKWRQIKKRPVIDPEKVIITAFINGWCSGYNIGFENFRQAAAKFRDKAEFKIVQTLDPAVIKEWGITDAIFIDDEYVQSGPPPSYDDAVKMIKNKIKVKFGN